MNSNGSKTALSIVIPVYNSKDTIERLVEEIIENLKEKYVLEIILINDSSKDNSEEICIQIQQRHSSIISFYSLSRNVGEHNAVMAGLNHVTGDFTIIMDDDFQNPISEVIKMVDYALQHDFDVVYSYYAEKQHSIFRNLGSRFHNKVANVMLKKPKDLYLSSFKVLNRFSVNEIIKYSDPFPYVDGLVLRITNKIGKVQVEHNKRGAGKSGYTISKLISLYLIMFTNFSILPLRISSYAGFLFAMFGFVLAIIAIIEKFTNPHIPLGYSFEIIAILVFAGIQLLSIGMVGEYLGRLFLSQNKQPQYTIRKQFEKTKIEETPAFKKEDQ